MANRTFRRPFVQGVKHVIFGLKLKPNGSSAVTLGEGDSAGSFFTVTRNSAGNITLKTKDAYAAVVSYKVEATSGYRAKFGVPTQSADGTWSFPLYTATEATSVASVGSLTAGSGYTSAPAVALTSGGGTGAKAHAVLTADAVTSVVIDDPGFGYTSAPTVGFSGGGGSLAAGTAVLADGAAGDMPSGSRLVMTLIFRDSTVTP